MFSKFFIDLFTSTNPSNFDLCLENIKSCIKNKMNQLLMTDYTEVEVKEALFKMNPFGALGLDDFTACFY